MLFFFCTDVDCKLDHHISDISFYYSSVCDALIVASKAQIHDVKLYVNNSFLQILA